MFKKCIEKMLLVCVVAVAVMFCIPKNVYADSNTWVFASFRYDYSCVNGQKQCSSPAAWQRGTIILNKDLTAVANILESSDGNSPTGDLPGTYTITSDGQFDALIYDISKDPTKKNPIKVSGRLDKTNKVIVSTLMIDSASTVPPPTPGIVTMVLQAPLDVNKALLGTWAGQVLRVDTNGSMLWDFLNMTFKSNKIVTFTFNGSNGETGETGSFTGTYTAYPVDGHVIMKVTMDDKANPDVLDITAQISASGDISSIVFKSESTVNPSFGMGNMIKSQASATSIGSILDS